jgi:hypothetical protein
VIDDDDQSGLGDITQSLFFSAKPPIAGGWILGDQYATRSAIPNVRGSPGSPQTTPELNTPKDASVVK